MIISNELFYSYPGIGSIPDACLSRLMDHKNLGIHSEMFSDGVVPLVERGAVTNAFKTVLPGRCVGSFIIGTEKVFEFIDENPFVGKYCKEKEIVILPLFTLLVKGVM
mgnify:CR=1 FL=1